MSEDLAGRIAPRHTAVLTMELQRGVIGDLARFPVLARCVKRANLFANTARLLAGARAAGAHVVHCSAAFPRDRAGTRDNVPMLRRYLEDPEYLALGSAEAETAPEIGREAGDLESLRLHGVSPFAGTSLDALLRGAGVDCVIATGVSLNIGISGLVIEAVNHGYHVVVARDCVVGVPLEYGQAVLENSLAAVATLATADEILGAWSAGG